MTRYEHPPFLLDPTRSIFFKALRVALSRPAIWITAAVLTLILAGLAALPWSALFHQIMGSGYEPGELIRELPETFRFDHREAMGTLASATGASGGMIVWLAALLGCFVAGGWLQVMLEHSPGGTLRRFFFGGSRFFFRFIRVFVLTLLLMHLVGWLVNGKPWEQFVHEFLFGIEGGNLESLESETTARRLVWARDLTYMALVALIFVWGTYTRTRLALHDTQSTVWAGLCTWSLLFLHPVQTLRPMVFMFGAQALVLLSAGLLTAWFQGMLGEPGDWLPVVLLFSLTIVTTLWRAIVRGASYHVALVVSANLVKPLSRPDPWKKSIGGPGGPQYPIGEDDEYGVSL